MAQAIYNAYSSFVCHPFRGVRKEFKPLNGIRLGKDLSRLEVSEGAILIAAARSSIELHLRATKVDKKALERIAGHIDNHYGIFVTLRHYPIGEMRGRAGFTRSTMPLKSVIVEAAIGATVDARFVPVSHLELEHIVIELSIVSEPKRLPNTLGAIGKNFNPKADALLIEYGYRQGIVLPEPSKKKRAIEETLEEATKRAGMRSEEWRRPDARIFKLAVQSFSEKEPNGEVEEANLK